MKDYWDSSALVEAVYEPALMRRLQAEPGLTRPHSLAEVFSVLTGNPESRIAPDDAALVLEKLSASLEFVEIGAVDILAATKRAGKLGVRGGRVHDLLHAVAAEKAPARKLLTLDRHDFKGLTGLEIEVL